MNLKKFFKTLGPGVTTGSADNDPSGIATYSQTGAQFGYGQLWTSVFILPFLIAIQEACARIGAVTGKGIAGNIKKHYTSAILYPLILLVLAANIINLGADLGAMAAAVRLLVPLNFTFLTFAFSIGIVLAEIFFSYRTYANFLKWLCLFLLAYPLTVFIVKPHGLTLLKATFIPHIEWNFQFIFIITGVFGTTISPYLFFWQTSEVVEEKHKSHLTHKALPKFTQRLRVDNFVGMLFSQITTWCVIVVTATVLHTHGVTDIKTSAEAAKGLEPFVSTFPNAGYLAKAIFAIGIIGLGLLAVPILAGSVAYAISETFNFNAGLDKKFKEVPGFYTVIIIATALGLLIDFVGIDPFKALIYSAVINGIVAVPLIFIIAVIINNKKIMGKYKSGLLSTIFVWLTFIGMLVFAAALLISIFR